MSIELYWEGVPLPPWLGDAADHAIDAATRANRLGLEGDMLTVRAIWLMTNGNRGAGLSAALEGVARRDEYLLTTETSLVRMMTGMASEYGRLVALAAAIEDGNPHLAAELIETSRLQVEPALAGHSSSSVEPSSTRSRVAELHGVSVCGVSVLAHHYRVLSPKAVAIEDMIAATGGVDAQWWGAWANNERVHWALRLYGRWSAGTIRLTPGSQVSSLLRQAVEFPRRCSSRWRMPLTAASRCRWSYLESLCPPTGPVACGQPRAWLDAHSCCRGRRATRGRTGDPHAARRGSRSASGGSLPDHGGMRGSARRPAVQQRRSRRARTVLGQSDAPEAIPATLENLRASLPSPGGHAGLFYYSGHAASEGLGGDHEDALVLSAGETLSAGALFESAQAGRGPFFPSRTMLSACSSSGAAGAGAGEWLGLTAAVLWKGARQVLATNWPIWDTSFTLEFDLNLVRRLQRQGDAAAALREVQLEALESWRESLHDFTGYEGEDMSLDDFSRPFPLI